MEWLGELHPFTAHFSVGLVPAGLLVLLVYYFKQHDWLLYTALVLFALGTVSAFVSYASGDIAHEASENIPGVYNAMKDHEDWANYSRWSMLLLTVLTWIYLQYKDTILAFNRDFSYWAVVLFGTWTLIAMISTGLKGGNLVYDYMVAGSARGHSAQSVDRQEIALYYSKIQFLKEKNNGLPDNAGLAALYREIQEKLPQIADFKIMHADFLSQEMNKPQEALDVLSTIISTKELQPRQHYRMLAAKYRVYLKLNDSTMQDAVKKDIKNLFPNSQLAKD